MIFESATPLNGIIIIVYHCLSFYNMLGAAEDIKKTQLLPWGSHSDRQTNKMYLRRGRWIAEMQFPRCLYLCFGFVCLLTSCRLKKSWNFSSEQGRKWWEFRRKHKPWSAERRAERLNSPVRGTSMLSNSSPLSVSLNNAPSRVSSPKTQSLI